MSNETVSSRDRALGAVVAAHILRRSGRPRTASRIESEIGDAVLASGAAQEMAETLRSKGHADTAASFAAQATAFRHNPELAGEEALRRLAAALRPALHVDPRDWSALAKTVRVHAPAVAGPARQAYAAAADGIEDASELYAGETPGQRLRARMIFERALYGGILGVRTRFSQQPPADEQAGAHYTEVERGGPACLRRRYRLRGGGSAKGRQGGELGWRPRSSTAPYELHAPDQAGGEPTTITQKRRSRRMGLDITFDTWQGSYTGFVDWRAHIAEVAGYREEAARARGEQPAGLELGLRIEWDGVTSENIAGFWTEEPEDVLIVLLVHSHSDGWIYPQHTGRLARRLEGLLPDVADEFRDATEQFIEGLRAATAFPGPVEFS